MIKDGTRRGAALSLRQEDHDISDYTLSILALNVWWIYAK